MQFPPGIDGGEISVYDNRILRTIKYKYDSDGTFEAADQSTSVQVQKFVTDGSSFMNSNDTFGYSPD